MSTGNFDNVSFDIGIGGFDGDSGDTHDGWKRQRVEYGPDDLDDQIREYRAKKDKLRSDLMAVIAGPQAEEAREVLAEVPAPADTPIEDFEPRMAGLLAESSLLREIARLAMAEHQRLLDEDEDDVLALVLH